MRSAFSFHVFHFLKPVDLQNQAVEVLLEFFLVHPLRELAISDIFRRRPSIFDQIPALIKVPVAQGFVRNIYGGCFGILVVSKSLAPNVLTIFHGIDYFGIKRQLSIGFRDQTDKVKLVKSAIEMYCCWERW